MTDIVNTPTILIVDDDPVNVKILAEALHSTYRIKIAANGVEALNIAKCEQPDLILLDVMMPHMDGFEVCRRLKSDSNTQKIAVIFVTVLHSEIDEEKGLNLGAVDYIGKPFVMPIIKARIRTYIRLKLQADLLESLSFLDALTHIPNRRRFDEMLLSEWRRAARDATPISLIMIDVDYFKKYNDNYGHGKGDVCLQNVATTLSNSLVRPSDFVARYGGEEFVVILPNTNQQAAVQIAERLRERVEKIALPHTYSNVSSVVTISLGVATQRKIPEHSLPQTLTEAADKALYMAKEGGRNRVFSNPNGFVSDHAEFAD